MAANTDTVQQSDVLMGHLTHHTDRFKESLAERAQCQRSESKVKGRSHKVRHGWWREERCVCVVACRSNDLLASWVECY